MAEHIEDEAREPGITVDFPFSAFAGLRNYLQRHDCVARVVVEMSESAAPSVVRRIAAAIAAEVDGMVILGDDSADYVARMIGRFAVEQFAGRPPFISVDVAAGRTRGRWNNRDAS